MNCQELTALLDDGDIRDLSPLQRRELDAHLSGCASCAAEWRVQEKIAMTPTMWVPVGFVAQCRQLVAAGASRLFAPRRVILYSGLLVLAAAAALLAWRHGARQAPAAAIAAPIIAVADPVPEQLQPVDAPAPEPVATTQPVKPPAGVFTVNVPPLRIEGEDAEGSGLATLFRNRVLTLLQGVPNLVLVEAPPASGAAEYELQMTYAGAMQAMPYMRSVRLEVTKSAELAATEAAIAAEAGMSPEDRQRSEIARGAARMQTQMASLRSGNVALTLLLGTGVPTTSMIYDRLSSDRVETSAHLLVRQLRTNVFPLDESFEQDALAALRNPALTHTQRQRALGALLIYAERRGGFPHASPNVVRAGGEYALIAETDVAQLRLAIWEGLALTRSPELVPYLVRGLDEIALTEIRLLLVKILAEQYGDDPRARAALAAAAKSNDQPTVRMAAVRRSDEAGWREYVVATLGNSSLPDLQRLQPMAEMAPGGPGALGTSPKTEMVLAEPQLRELGEVLIRVATDRTATDVARQALFAAGAMETPAALDMLIHIVDSLDLQNGPRGLEGVSMQAMQSTAVQLIGFRYAGNAKARTALEKVAKGVDSMGRMTAQMALETLDRRAIMEKAPSQQPGQ